MKHHLMQLPRFDSDVITGITGTIERAFASSGLQDKDGLLNGITETIRQALTSTGVAQGVQDRPSRDASVIDVVTRELGSLPEHGLERAPAQRPPATSTPGEFLTKHFSNQAGSRDYKLYVPARACDGLVPLVVMLHGCTQSPDDFAAGTQMNQLAEKHGFLVVYPEQAASANGSKCWNWFNAQDQGRGAGEPSLIAGITREVAATHPVDTRRIYVAGLSAGAAMAVILGEAYPDLFAAVGAHSGLPYGAAHDMPSAFAAMKGGRGAAAQLANLPGAARPVPAKKALQPVPTIVFHGDRDHTVSSSNGTAIIEQAIESTGCGAGQAPLHSTTHRGTAAGGRTYSRTVYSDGVEKPKLESWVLHGGGHAWSGGDRSGSYTDTSGPDASAEMVRFFLQQANGAIN